MPWWPKFRCAELVRIREQAAGVVRDLFLAFRDRPELMPAEWAAKAMPRDHTGRRERVVCDYIAGMTDRYALAEHRRHHATTPELRYGSR